MVGDGSTGGRNDGFWLQEETQNRNRARHPLAEDLFERTRLGRDFGLGVGGMGRRKHYKDKGDGDLVRCTGQGKSHNNTKL